MKVLQQENLLKIITTVDGGKHPQECEIINANVLREILQETDKEFEIYQDEGKFDRAVQSSWNLARLCLKERFAVLFKDEVQP